VIEDTCSSIQCFVFWLHGGHVFLFIPLSERYSLHPAPYV
jgi:hypothetical protein